jgi:hypothetical protein
MKHSIFFLTNFALVQAILDAVLIENILHAAELAPVKEMKGPGLVVSLVFVEVLGVLENFRRHFKLIKLFLILLG